MIIAKNFGCTDFIIGHDHAGPGVDGNGQWFYQNGSARRLAQEHAAEIGVDITPFEQMVYLPFEDEFRPADQVPEGVQSISLSGSDIRKRLQRGRNIPEWMTFPEVLEELHKAYPPPGRQGFTIFLTGLSGAGKSTIAKILYSRFLEIGERPVSLLDYDRSGVPLLEIVSEPAIPSPALARAFLSQLKRQCVRSRSLLLLCRA